nr:DUF2877 domain-containing protein [Raoultella sp. 10-1]
MLTLLCADYDNAPNSCRLALTHFDNLLRPGQPVRFLDSGIAFGDSGWIETSLCRRWQMAKPTLSVDRLRHIPWRRWSQTLRQQLREDETLFLYRGNNPFHQEISRQLRQRRRILLAALQQGEEITPAVSSMLGLGIGLTPSADDYLVGMSTILLLPGHPAEKYREDFLLALQRTGNNTTTLSAITLEAALNQRYRESIARFIHYLLNEPESFSVDAIGDIKNIGSSSGCDMLYGMADACALSQAYGGNDVS